MQVSSKRRSQPRCDMECRSAWRKAGPSLPRRPEPWFAYKLEEPVPESPWAVWAQGLWVWRSTISRHTGNSRKLWDVVYSHPSPSVWSTNNWSRHFSANRVEKIHVSVLQMLHILQLLNVCVGRAGNVPVSYRRWGNKVVQRYPSKTPLPRLGTNLTH